MLIRIAKLGTGIRQVRLDNGCVDDAIAASGLSIDGLEARVDGQLVRGDHRLSDGDIITLVPESGIREEARIRLAGDIWDVYQNDPDVNFPSDFHAHNKVRRETLDVYTGNVYNAVTRKLLRRLSDKHLDLFLRQLPERLKR